eukprot:1056400-Pleurochrysis_carterae.AAC.1
MLDVRLLASGIAPGNLYATLDAIRYVLTEAESRSTHQRLLADGGSGGHALEVRPRQQKKKEKNIRAAPADDKKQHDARKLRPADGESWSTQWRPCRHCGGQHWHRDCPRKDASAAQVNGQANLSTQSAQSVQRASDPLDVSIESLFDPRGGPNNVELTDGGGKALCVHRSAGHAEKSWEQEADYDSDCSYSRPQPHMPEAISAREER